MSTSQDTAVRRSVTVPLPPDRAFALFTSRIGEFWPTSHSIGTAQQADVVVEPRAGGRWFERGTDGSECDWGRVAEWDPPGRLVLLWQITADWRHDPDFTTEVELTFTATGPASSRLDLVHRNLDRYGHRTQAMRDAFESPGGWDGILGAWAAMAPTA